MFFCGRRGFEGEGEFVQGLGCRCGRRRRRRRNRTSRCKGSFPYTYQRSTLINRCSARDCTECTSVQIIIQLEELGGRVPGGQEIWERSRSEIVEGLFEKRLKGGKTGCVVAFGAG